MIKKLSTDIEDSKKKIIIHILEVKTTMCMIEKSLDGLNDRVHRTKKIQKNLKAQQ